MQECLCTGMAQWSNGLGIAFATLCTNLFFWGSFCLIQKAVGSNLIMHLSYESLVSAIIYSASGVTITILSWYLVLLYNRYQWLRRYIRVYSHLINQNFVRFCDNEYPKSIGT